MAETTMVRLRTITTFGVGGALVFAAVAAAVSSATAGADVTEIRPRPGVTSGQTDDIRPDSTFGEVRGGKVGEVSGQGEIRDSLMAVPGSVARGFRGGWSNGIQGGLR